MSQVGWSNGRHRRLLLSLINYTQLVETAPVQMLPIINEIASPIRIFCSTFALSSSAVRYIMADGSYAFVGEESMMTGLPFNRSREMTAEIEWHFAGKLIISLPHLHYSPYTNLNIHNIDISGDAWRYIPAQGVAKTWGKHTILKAQMILRNFIGGCVYRPLLIVKAARGKNCRKLTLQQVGKLRMTHFYWKQLVHERRRTARELL